MVIGPVFQEEDRVVDEVTHDGYEVVIHSLIVVNVHFTSHVSYTYDLYIYKNLPDYFLNCNI